ncbi:Hypothetical predicted protein, partial [Paramuricea clavata]
MNSTFADMLFPADEAPYLSTYVDDILSLSSTSAKSTSSSEMESLMDVKTLVVLESCLDVDVDLSPENELAQDQLIALKPSLFEFRDEQRLCPKLMPIIQYLTDLSPEQSPEKHSKFQGYE